MILFNLILLVFLKIDVNALQSMKHESFEDYGRICDNVVLRPFFKNELVTNVRWRVYYIWNSLPETTCRDMKFKNINALVSKFCIILIYFDPYMGVIWRTHRVI